MYMCTHIYMYFYIYLYTFQNHDFILIPPDPIQHDHSVHSSLLLKFSNDKIGSHYIYILPEIFFESRIHEGVISELFVYITV